MPLEVRAHLVQNDFSHGLFVQIAPKIRQELVVGPHQVHYNCVVQGVLLVRLNTECRFLRICFLEHFNYLRRVVLQRLQVLFLIVVCQVNLGDMNLKLLKDVLKFR